MPPRKAFNDCGVLLARIDTEKSQTQVRWRHEERRGGNFEYVLCGKCNNDTGSWYGSEYVRFAKALAEFASPENAEETVDIRLHNLFPLRVVKQALAMMCASCGAGLAEKNPVLREMILHKLGRGIPGHLRVFAYLLCHEGGRSTGIAGMLNTSTGRGKVVAEFSWWPVGWILTFEDYADINAFDVTWWCRCDYKEKRSVALSLPCHWNCTAYPLDFRNPDEVATALAASSEEGGSE